MSAEVKPVESSAAEPSTRLLARKTCLAQAPVRLLKERPRGESRLDSQYHIPQSSSYSELLKSTLTLQPKSFSAFATPKPYPLFEETDGILSMPRIFGLLQFGPPDVDDRTALLSPETCRAREWERTLVLRPWQARVADHVFECLLAPPLHCGMLSAACGLGKTCMAIEIMCRLGVRAAVLTHKEFLSTQWEERLRQFCPGIGIGRVQGDTMQVGEHVTIVMIQTVCTGRFNVEDFKDIDFVVVDECHHISAGTFNRAMRVFRARHCMGLSATLTRSDGNERAIFWLLGDPVAVCQRRDSAAEGRLSVRMAHAPSDCRVPEARTAANTLQYSTMLTRLLAKKSRLDLVAREVRLLHDEGRDTLVISERIDLLDRIKETLERDHGVSAVKYVGETSKRAKAKRDEEAKDARVILTTRAMASEGFDQPRISAVVLATPLRQGPTLEQSIGRCQRGGCCPTATGSVVVDIVDSFSLFASMARGREAWYKARNFDVRKTWPAGEEGNHWAFQGPTGPKSNKAAPSLVRKRPRSPFPS